jgi:hypothetical protein
MDDEVRRKERSSPTNKTATRTPAATGKWSLFKKEFELKRAAALRSSRSEFLILALTNIARATPPPAPIEAMVNCL